MRPRATQPCRGSLPPQQACWGGFAREAELLPHRASTLRLCIPHLHVQEGHGLRSRPVQAQLEVWLDPHAAAGPRLAARWPLGAEHLAAQHLTQQALIGLQQREQQRTAGQGRV